MHLFWLNVAEIYKIHGTCCIKIIWNIIFFGKCNSNYLVKFLGYGKGPIMIFSFAILLPDHTVPDGASLPHCKFKLYFIITLFFIPYIHTFPLIYVFLPSSLSKVCIHFSQVLKVLISNTVLLGFKIHSSKTHPIIIPVYIHTVN